MVYPFFFFTMKEGVSDVEYRITYRFGNTGCVNEKVCKFSPEKKDERFSWICGIFQGEPLWKISFITSFPFLSLKFISFNLNNVKRVLLKSIISPSFLYYLLLLLFYILFAFNTKPCYHHKSWSL